MKKLVLNKKGATKTMLLSKRGFALKLRPVLLLNVPTVRLVN